MTFSLPGFLFNVSLYLFCILYQVFWLARHVLITSMARHKTEQVMKMLTKQYIGADRLPPGIRSTEQKGLGVNQVWSISIGGSSTTYTRFILCLVLLCTKVTWYQLNDFSKVFLLDVCKITDLVLNSSMI